MSKKNKNQEAIIVSEFFVEAESLEKRYKSLKKTLKKIKEFTEIQIKGPRAEA